MQDRAKWMSISGVYRARIGRFIPKLRVENIVERKRQEIYM
jgi:hypothetical protein